MARRDQSNARKLELLNELTKHRLQIKVKRRALAQQLALSVEHVKDSINIPKFLGNKIKSSFKTGPTKWFIASTIGGLIISKFFSGLFSSNSKEANGDKQKLSNGLFFTIVGYVARPLIKSFLIGKAQRYIAQKFLGHQDEYSQYDYPPYSDYDIQ